MKRWMQTHRAYWIWLLPAGLALIGCEKRVEPPPPPPPAPTEPAAEATPNVHRWIAEGDETAFRVWLEQTADVDERGIDQATPLLTAALYGRTSMVRALLEHGADPSRVDLYGFTALHAAAREGHTEIARLLVERGSDPSVTDYDGLSAYDIAVMMGHTDTAALLAEMRRPEPDSAITTEEGTNVESEVQRALLSTDFRTWTSVSGDTLEAAFIQNVMDTVILQGRDGRMIRIGLNRLQASDQAVVRQLSGVDPHALAAARGRTPPTASKKPDSLALRMGRDKGWTLLEDCRLLKRSGNDGDSFHVEHEGKEYIFRLYFVDTAETSDTYPDRVRDQAAYFHLDTDQTLKLGKEASRFTTSLLARGPFTVLTRWEDARGNSHLPRYYALVVTSLGDLDELLTREGLVRCYGMPVKSNTGERKLALLKKLEDEAKQERVGAWK